MHLQIRRPLWTLPISDTILKKFKDEGFEYVEEILHEANAEGNFHFWHILQCWEIDECNFFSVTKQILQGTKIDISQLTKISTKTALEVLKVTEYLSVH